MFKRILAAVALSALLPLAAAAAPITYVYSGVGSGIFDGQAFSDTDFVITAQADTANIGPWCCSNLQNTHSSASIQLQGFGTFAIVASTHTWIAEGCCMGIGLNLAANLITLADPGLVSVGYDLATAIGPILDAAPTTHGQFNNVQTSGGLLTISALRHVSFQAITQSVPEPGSLALLGLGLAALAARRRR